MQIQESGEMYLETILVLSKSKASVHAIDISDYMNFSKPSVSRAMGILKTNGLIEVAKDGSITLTSEGMEIATKIYERHEILTSLLIRLGVSPETATEDACKIEHDLSDETFEAIKRHIKAD